MQTQAKTGWTDERRAKHAAAIKRWKPWEKSTGPRTAAGKARAAQNAYKHGQRAGAARLLGEAVAAQNQCLHIARAYSAFQKFSGTNELLARLCSDFHRNDRIFHVRLAQALEHERLCKKLAFSGPPVQIVNANDN
jgi:thioredoxin-like negative regulator of GroEL